MKKHKAEIVALTLLLGVLCYAFYDSNIESREQKIVLTNELFSMKEIKNKEEITMEMLEIPTEDLLKAQEENGEEENNNREEAASNSTELILANYNASLVETVDNEVPYNEIISNQVVNYALKFVGNPYVYGGYSLTNGTDCSGFTKLIFDNYGITLPRSAPEQAYSGFKVELDNLMPGDLVFSGYGGQIGHVAIYIGNEKLVHALNSSVGIVVTSLYIMPIIDARRVA